MCVGKCVAEVMNISESLQPFNNVVACVVLHAVVETLLGYC